MPSNRTTTIQNWVDRYYGDRLELIPDQLDSLRDEQRAIKTLLGQIKDLLERQDPDRSGLTAILTLQGNIISAISTQSRGLELLSTFQSALQESLRNSSESQSSLAQQIS